MPYGYVTIKGKHYKKIAGYRAKFMAEGYAATLRLGLTDYTDIQVVRSGSWWVVCRITQDTYLTVQTYRGTK